jgi:hypothetical protein
MAKLQIPYNNAKRKFRMSEIPALQKQIQELQSSLSQTSNPDEKKSLKAQMDALNIKIKSFRQSDPVKDGVVLDSDKKLDEDGEGGSPTISTSSIGGTTTDSDGNSVSNPNSYMFKPSSGVVGRGGKYWAPKKNRKKKIREFTEYYFEESTKEQESVQYKGQTIRVHSTDFDVGIDGSKDGATEYSVKLGGKKYIEDSLQTIKKVIDKLLQK